MTETDRVRPEVVDAIVAALIATDPAGLPEDATRAEKDAARDLFFTRTAAERGQRDRQSRAWELLLTRSYDDPPTWAQLFDDLPPAASPSWASCTTPCRPARRPSTPAASGPPTRHDTAATGSRTTGRPAPTPVASRR